MVFVCLFDRCSKVIRVCAFTLDATGLNDHIHLFTVFYGNKKCAHERAHTHTKYVTRLSLSECLSIPFLLLI